MAYRRISPYSRFLRTLSETMTASFHLLQPTYGDRDERPYNHRVRIGSVVQGSLGAQHRFTFYHDNKLRWQGNEPKRAEDGRTEYGFPDEATARKFAERFGGEYMERTT